MSEQPVSTQKRRTWIPWAAGALVAAIAAGLGAYLAFGRPTALERDDPAGAKACRQLSDWIRGDLRDPDTRKPASEGLAAIALAGVAKSSKTPAIRSAAGANLMSGSAGSLVQSHGGPAELRFADLKAMHAACVGVGEKMPPYATPAA